MLLARSARGALYVFTLIAALLLLTLACVIVNRYPQRADGDLRGTRPVTKLKGVTKIHLLDGSLVVFPAGVVCYESRRLIGHGLRYDFLRRPTGEVQTVTLDSVAFVRVYRDRPDWDALPFTAPWPAYVLGAGCGLVLGSGAMDCSFYGPTSCPTGPWMGFGTGLPGTRAEVREDRDP
jgi:hypothetical protein